MVFSFLVKLIYRRCLRFLFKESVERVSCKSLSCLSIILLNTGDKQETSKLKAGSVQNIVFFKIVFSAVLHPFSRQSYLLFINGTKSACFASVGKFFSRLYCLLAFVLVGKACNSLKKERETKMLLIVTTVFI